MGIAGLLGFYEHAFNAAATAEYIGWAPGSPFQFEVAVANLAFGVLGVLCLWFRGGFWAATIVGFAVFIELIGLARTGLEEGWDGKEGR